MNGNLAYQEEPREEMLNGKIYMISSPSVNHNRTASKFIMKLCSNNLSIAIEFITSW